MSKKGEWKDFDPAHPPEGEIEVQEKVGEKGKAEKFKCYSGHKKFEVLGWHFKFEETVLRCIENPTCHTRPRIKYKNFQYQEVGK